MIEIDSDWFTKLLDFDTLWHNTSLQALLPFQICNLNDWSQSSSGSTAKCILPLKFSRIVWLILSHVASAWAENSSEEINVVTSEFFKTLTNFDQYQPSNILKYFEIIRVLQGSSVRLHCQIWSSRFHRPDGAQAMLLFVSKSVDHRVTF